MAAPDVRSRLAQVGQHVLGRAGFFQRVSQHQEPLRVQLARRQDALVVGRLGQ
jgi:hypothetical protein